LTPEEKAKILKEKKVDIMPPGIKNLGNTCYMNSTVQCLARIKELTSTLDGYSIPGADGRDIDAVLTNQLKTVASQLNGPTTEAIVPLQFVMALRAKFPMFGEMQNGHYMQQDADECLRGILTSLSSALRTPGGNRIDELFGFKLRSSLKCLECDEEAPTTAEETQRVLICHLGTQIEPISHIYQGVQLSLKEHVEKNSPSLGRNAQYEKSAAIASLPSYLVVQFARFGYKKANNWAGTSDSKVKLVKSCKFSPTFDLYDMATEDLKKQLSKGRLRAKEQEDRKMEEEKKKMLADAKGEDGKGASSSSAPGAADKDGDVEMKPASTVGVEEVDTGCYQLVGIVSHKGRTADGGHYVGWTLLRKGNPKEKKEELKEDQWICYDDEDVTQWNWKDITGISMDLMGGRADTQIAYINIYKKVTVSVDAGQSLGDEPMAGRYEEAAAAGSAAAPASGSGDAAMPPAP